MNVGGVGAIPAGATGAWVTITTTATDNGGLAIGPTGATVPNTRVAVNPAGKTATTTVWAALGADGKFQIRNYGTQPATVTVTTTGWTT